MPFIVRSPEHYDPTLTLTISHPSQDDLEILRKLQGWGWFVIRRDSNDNDYIDALTQIEKDIKKRRRQTHAVAGELLGYKERPTLHQLWAHEARKRCEEPMQEAPDLQGSEASNPRSSWIERRTETEKAWLRCIDRTRQTNGYLEYKDPGQEIPRLLTVGLDRTYDDAHMAWEPAHERYIHDSMFKMPWRGLGRHFRWLHRLRKGKLITAGDKSRESDIGHVVCNMRPRISIKLENHVILSDYKAMYGYFSVLG